jgi:hypothetical protein
MNLEIKNGDPSAYGFACGYRATREINGFTIDLRGGKAAYRYQLRVHDHKAGTRVLWTAGARLGDARRHLDRAFRACRDLPDMIRHAPDDHDQHWIIT